MKKSQILLIVKTKMNKIRITLSLKMKFHKFQKIFSQRTESDGGNQSLLKLMKKIEKMMKTKCIWNSILTLSQA